MTLAYLELIHVRWMFAAAGAALLLGLINLLINYQYLSENLPTMNKNENNRHLYKSIGVIILLIISIFIVLTYRDVKYILEISLIFITIFFTIALIRIDHVRRVKLIAVLFILGGLVIAEICYRQGYTIIKFFTDEYVNRTVDNIIIPTNMFQTLDPIIILFIFPFILMLRKFLEKHKKSLNPGTSMSTGLLFLSVSFGFLLFGYYTINHDSSSHDMVDSILRDDCAQ